MELVKKDNSVLTFRADIDESLANVLRRYVNEIPVLAIDDVEISKNDSALYDETIAHRLGLVPLKMDNRMGESTTATFKLASNKEGFVNSGEITGGKGVVYNSIPITLLSKGQELEISATAKIGKASQHAKYSCGIMFYRDSENPEAEKADGKGLFIGVEAYGQIPVDEILPKAIDELKKDLDSVSKNLK